MVKTKKLDVEETYALMNFLYKIPLEVASISQRFSIFQEIYPTINEFNFSYFFLYITEKLLAKIDNVQEIVDTLPCFSGCEILKITEDIAMLSADEFFSIVYHEDKLSLDNVGRSIDRVLQYIKKIRLENTDARRIPEQEKGWTRYLFREWFLYHYFYRVAQTTGIEIYQKLMERNWYSKRDNQCLKIHMEQEANIAIGRIFRYLKYTPKAQDFLEFVENLTDSQSLIDQQNALYIIYHTVPTEAGQPIGKISDFFEATINRLYSRPGMANLKLSSIGRTVFGQFNVGGSDSSRQ